MKYAATDWQQPAPFSPGHSGFTLLEAMIVLTLLAILAAMAAPFAMAWWNARCLTVAQQEIYQALRQVQSDALQQKREGQFSIREQGNRLEWANHAATLDPAKVHVWKPLEKSVTFDLKDTTLLKKRNVYYIQFSYRGNTSARLGRVTLVSKNGGRAKRCVIVSTLIGALRQGRERPTPDSSGRYCY